MGEACGTLWVLVGLLQRFSGEVSQWLIDGLPDGVCKVVRESASL